MFSIFQNAFSQRLLACALALAATLACATDSFTASVSSTEVVTGDPIRLKLTYAGTGNPQGLPVFEHPEVGRFSNPSTQQFSSWQNGVSSASLSWVYSVVPEGTGTVHFGSAFLELESGQRLSATIPDVRVGPPPPQPWLRLSLSSSSSEVLVEEPFDVTLSVEMAIPQSGGTRMSPLAVRPAPHLQVPFLDEPPESCEPAEDVGSILSRFLVRGNNGPGFMVNSFCEKTRSPFDDMGSPFGGFPDFDAMMGRSAPLLFDFFGTDVVENGTNILRGAVTIPFRARQEGPCRFDAARFDGALAIGGRATREFTALSEPLVVRVVPPPAEGRPDSFIGGIGLDLSAEASIDFTTCRQGDPLTLTLDLNGDQTWQTVVPPDLPSRPGMAGVFRSYGSVESTMADGHPRFVYHIRPLVSGTLEIPAFELSFFHRATRTYRTIRTAPVPLRVEAVPDFDADALFAAAATNAAVSVLAAPTRHPSALHWALRAPEPSQPGFRPQGFLAAPAVCALAFLFMALWRRRHAMAASLRRLASRFAGGPLARLRRAETPQEVMDAVRRYLKEKTHEDVPGLTPGDVRAILSRHGADPAAAKDLEQTLQALFDASFRPGADPAKAVREERGRLADLLKGLRLLVAFALLFAGLGAAGAAESNDFVWRQANALAAKARTSDDWLGVARLYRELSEREPNLPHPYENEATALLLAAESADEADAPRFRAAARDAVLRAEAISGTTPEIENNLLLSAENSESLETALPWYRPLLPFHYGWAPERRWMALLAAWSVFWLLVPCLRIRRLRSAIVPLLVLSFLAAAAFAASLWVSRSRLAEPRIPFERTEATR